MNQGPLNTKRRFIAGAVCPRCKEMDTIIMFRQEGTENRECVSCDFAEQSNFNQPAEELATRVTRPAAAVTEPVESDVQVVRILDPNSK